MAEMILIDTKICSNCGLCAEICPGKILTKNDPDGISIRQPRLHLCVSCGHCMAVCPTESIAVAGLSYSKDFAPLPATKADATAFFDLVRTRRAVRNFEDKPVPRELLQEIVNAIAFSPPSFPPVKIELTIVQDTAVMRKALPYMVQVYDSMVRAMGNPLIRCLIRSRLDKGIYRMLLSHVVPIMKAELPDMKSGIEDAITRNAPSMILFHACRDSDNYKTDIHIALAHGWLAAHSIGLGAAAIDLVPPAIDRSKELRKLFAIPGSNEVVAALIIGFAKYRYRKIIRRELKGVSWI